MTSRGEIVRKVVKDSGMPVSRLAEKIHISRSQLHIDFGNPQMPFDRILAIGKVLGYDFSRDFKELTPALTIGDQESSLQSTALQDCQGKLIDTQSKLITAMELLSRYQKKYGLDI